MNAHQRRVARRKGLRAGTIRPRGTRETALVARWTDRARRSPYSGKIRENVVFGQTRTWRGPPANLQNLPRDSATGVTYDDIDVII